MEGWQNNPEIKFASLKDLLEGESKSKKTLEEREREARLELQKEFAKWTKMIVNRWIVGLVFVFSIIMAYKGLWEWHCAKTSSCPESNFMLLPTWVLVTLLGASTATIVGLPLVVIKGLFPGYLNKNLDK